MATIGSPATPRTGGSTEPPGRRTPPVVAPEGVEFITPPTTQHDSFDADDDPFTEHRFRPLVDVYASTAKSTLLMERLLLAEEEPATFAEAASQESWRSTMLEELASIAVLAYCGQF
ncbi:hypothetical protein D1007_62206 [Hordeum vulgare]|nr:hypothetical protein D1007_62206 [Hordeum vulgare]